MPDVAFFCFVALDFCGAGCEAAGATGATGTLGPVGPVVPLPAAAARASLIFLVDSMKSRQISAGKVPPATG